MISFLRQLVRRLQNMPILSGEEVPGPPTGYHGPAVSFTPAMHAPGSDWMWQLGEVQAFMRSVDLPVKFLSIGFSADYWAAFHKPAFHLVRIYWQPDRRLPASEVWDYVSDGVMRFYNQGARKFELFNEPNLRHEGLGVVWQDGAGFAAWLLAFIALMKAHCPEAQLYYPGMSPGVPWTNQFVFTDAAWPLLAGYCDGICMHAYTGTTNDVEKAAGEVIFQVREFQKRMALDRPLVVSECSVNRAASSAYKAAVYRRIEAKLGQMPGVEALVYFISHWDAPPAQAGHGESWMGTDLLEHYRNLPVE